MNSIEKELSETHQLRSISAVKPVGQIVYESCVVNDAIIS